MTLTRSKAEDLGWTIFHEEDGTTKLSDQHAVGRYLYADPSFAAFKRDGDTKIEQQSTTLKGLLNAIDSWEQAQAQRVTG